jgi:hypothetical protein
MLKMSATNIGALLTVMCNGVEYFLQFLQWNGGKFSFMSEVLPCSSEHPTSKSLRSALSIWWESEHSENLSHHCGNVKVHRHQTLTFFLQKRNFDGRHNVALQHGFLGNTCDICFQEKWPY